jgi:hypothetical protein
LFFNITFLIIAVIGAGMALNKPTRRASELVLAAAFAIAAIGQYVNKNDAVLMVGLLVLSAVFVARYFKK